MRRQEFPKSIKVAVIKRATINGVVYCEECHGIAKSWQIDHIAACAHDPDGGTPVLENAQLLCKACFTVKNADDTTVAAKLKRQEARHLGAVAPKKKIQSRGFSKTGKEPKIAKASLPPRALYK